MGEITIRQPHDQKKRGREPIWQALYRMSGVDATHIDAIGVEISELELSFFRSKPRNLEFSKKLVNGLFATEERSTANVDYRVWLEQRRHASNISRVLSRYQQSLQILGIVGRLSCR